MCPFPSQSGQGTVLDQAACPALRSTWRDPVPSQAEQGSRMWTAGPGSIPTDCSRPDRGLLPLGNGWADSANGRRGLWTGGPLTVATPGDCVPGARKIDSSHSGRRSHERKRRAQASVQRRAREAGGQGRHHATRLPRRRGRHRRRPRRRRRVPPPDRLRGDGPRRPRISRRPAAASRLLPAHASRTPTRASRTRSSGARSRSTARRPTTHPRSTPPRAAPASTPRWSTPRRSTTA